MLFLPLLTLVPAALVHAIAPLELAPGEGIANQYIVTLSDDADVLGLLDTLAPAVTDNIEFVYDDSLKGFSGSFDDATLNVIRLLPAVEAVEQDQIYRAHVVQKPAPFNLAIISAKGNKKLAPAKQNAYYYQKPTHKTHPIYVIDTGVDDKHPQFQGRAKQIKTFIRGEPNRDLEGHGTHVAGIAAAKTYGVCKFCKILGVKVLDSGGSGSTSGVIAGVNYVGKNAGGKPAVINMSLGGGKSRALDRAVGRVVGKGVVTVVAAGNEAVSACTESPSGALPAISVAAMTKFYKRVYFSNFGKCADIFAPGTNIKSLAPNGGTAVFSGTSQASPHVAGLAGYFMGVKGVYAAAAVERLIKSNAKKGLVTHTKGAPNLVANNGYF